MGFDRELAYQALAGLISEKRRRHSLGVESTARAMALHYGADAEKAAIAGLLHDAAKQMPPGDMITACHDMGYPLDEILLRNPFLLHAPAGAWLARTRFHIDDPDILQAITRHTLPEWPMTALDMILFVADFIEPTRDFAGVEALRAMAYGGLESVFLSALTCGIRYVLQDGDRLHPRSVEVYNHILLAKGTGR